MDEQAQDKPKRKPGRPKGAKNKNKVESLKEAMILAAGKAGVPKAEIVRQLDVSHKDVNAALSNAAPLPEDVEIASKQLADKLGSIVWRLVNAVDTDAWAAQMASGKNAALAIALGAMTDKRNLLLGKATEILESREVVQEAEEELKKIRQERETLFKALGGDVGNESGGN